MYKKITTCLSYFQHPWLLLSRLWMADIFFVSGWEKHQHWPGTLYLFAFEYKVPYLSVSLAAYLATYAEIIFSFLIAVGLFTRLACIPLLFMTGVIHFTYLNISEHFYWAMFFSFMIIRGPGAFSLDALIKYKRDLK